jgi:Holliday junction resolvase
MLKNKDRSRLFVMIEKKLQKKAKAYFEKEDADEICAYSDDLIEETEKGKTKDNNDVKLSLSDLKELM